VIGAQVSLGQEFLYVAIREREAQIPTDGQENHLRFLRMWVKFKEVDGKLALLRRKIPVT
jgi:hypothetical protein